MSSDMIDDVGLVSDIITLATLEILNDRKVFVSASANESHAHHHAYPS